MKYQFKELFGFDFKYIIFDDKLYYISNNSLFPVKIYNSKNKNIVYLIKDNKSHIYNLNKLLKKQYDFIIIREIELEYDKISTTNIY